MKYRPQPVSRDRDPWGVAEAEGKTTADRIQSKVRKILARHTPPPLPDGAAEKIEVVLRETEARSSKR